jgi:hypothetical protein
LSLYTGKKADAGACNLTKVVLQLSDFLLGCRGTVVTGSYYTSVGLTNIHHGHDTHLSMLHTGRKGNSYEVINAKLQKGDLVAGELQY